MANNASTDNELAKQLLWSLIQRDMWLYVAYVVLYITHRTEPLHTTLDCMQEACFQSLQLLVLYKLFKVGVEVEEQLRPQAHIQRAAVALVGSNNANANADANANDDADGQGQGLRREQTAIR